MSLLPGAWFKKLLYITLWQLPLILSLAKFQTYMLCHWVSGPGSTITVCKHSNVSFLHVFHGFYMSIDMNILFMGIHWPVVLANCL